MRRLFQYLYFLYAVIIFLAVMFIILPFVIGASFFGDTGERIVYFLLRVWGYIWFPFVGIFIKKKYATSFDKKQAYIYVINHSSYLDAAMIIPAIHYPFRPLGKSEIARIPFFGFIYRQAVVMVDRSNLRNRAQSMKEMHRVLQKGISVVIFPEGTFNESDRPLKHFYDGAFRLAIQNQVTIQPVLFLDNKRLMSPAKTISLRPGKARVLYLEKISVDEYSLQDLPLLKKQVFAAMESAMLKYQ